MAFMRLNGENGHHLCLNKLTIVQHFTDKRVTGELYKRVSQNMTDCWIITLSS
jgi:hypothetical protein